MKIKISLIIIIVAMAGYIGFYLKSNSRPSTLPTPSSSSDDVKINSNSESKTFVFNKFHGSSNISDKFQFLYPSFWHNDGQYFSPEPIEYYDQYSVKAPMYFDLILSSIFDQTEFKNQIDTDKRKSPDTKGMIDGKEFKRYDLIDYGSYGGESAGEVIIYVGPKINIDEEDYYLVFHWEEKPLTVTITGNDYRIFDKILTTLKFIK